MMMTIAVGVRLSIENQNCEKLQLKPLQPSILVSLDMSLCVVNLCHSESCIFILPSEVAAVSFGHPVIHQQEAGHSVRKGCCGSERFILHVRARVLFC